MRKSKPKKMALADRQSAKGPVSRSTIRLYQRKPSMSRKNFHKFSRKDMAWIKASGTAKISRNRAKGVINAA